MALKSWNLASCPYKSLTDGSTDKWTQSTTVAGEYYYTGGDLTEKPNYVELNATAVSEGTVGTLAAGSWAWGDNDSLGSDTLYVKLTDEADPDSKGVGYVQCSDPIELMQATSGLECILLSLLISNYSYENDANIWVFHTTSAGVVRFKWVLDLPATNSPFALDSKLVMNEGDKLKIMAGIEEVAVIASGDES
jgi:hypothetical protein